MQIRSSFINIKYRISLDRSIKEKESKESRLVISIKVSFREKMVVQMPFSPHVNQFYCFYFIINKLFLLF